MGDFSPLLPVVKDVGHLFHHHKEMGVEFSLPVSEKKNDLFLVNPPSSEIQSFLSLQ
jgi:hypothetical protein